MYHLPFDMTNTIFFLILFMLILLISYAYSSKFRYPTQFYGTHFINSLENQQAFVLQPIVVHPSPWNQVPFQSPEVELLAQAVPAKIQTDGLDTLLRYLSKLYKYCKLIPHEKLPCNE